MFTYHTNKTTDYDEKKDPERMTEPKCLHLQYRYDYIYIHTAAERYKYVEVVKQRYMYNYAEHS